MEMRFSLQFGNKAAAATDAVSDAAFAQFAFGYLLIGIHIH